MQDIQLNNKDYVIGKAKFQVKQQRLCQYDHNDYATFQVKYKTLCQRIHSGYARFQEKKQDYFRKIKWLRKNLNTKATIMPGKARWLSMLKELATCQEWSCQDVENVQKCIFPVYMYILM